MYTYSLTCHFILSLSLSLSPSPPIVFMKNEREKATWVDKIVVTLIHCLRDWLMTLPIQRMVSEGSLHSSTVNSIFEVIIV